MQPKERYFENAAATVIKNLKKRQMEGYYCPTRQEAVAKALSLMEAGAAVAWGGSMTIKETGLMDALHKGPYQLIDRELPKTPEEQRALYAQVIGCDTFFMGTNAITLDGELVNIDNRGNRVAFLCFGPRQVIILAGMNKLAPDRESALQRAHNMATPPNALRLDRKTPCAVSGRCSDCLVPDTLCSQIVITRRSSIPGRIKVILIGEELGY